MSNPEDGGAAGTDEQIDPAQAPQVQINAQYVKDLSFENPNAPQSLMTQADSPQIQVSVDVGAHAMGSNRFEVELRITAQAARGEQKMFVAEVLYAGVFTLVNVEAADVKPVCLVECPRLLFPFARRVVADATRDGGFPPLLLEPIDFGAMYLNSEHSQTPDLPAAPEA
tara:strand:+ start:394 stop:900 length:507 start_codon:yes stop_codon:yes gene_type:complete